MMTRTLELETEAAAAGYRLVPLRADDEHLVLVAAVERFMARCGMELAGYLPELLDGLGPVALSTTPPARLALRERGTVSGKTRTRDDDYRDFIREFEALCDKHRVQIEQSFPDVYGLRDKLDDDEPLDFGRIWTPDEVNKVRAAKRLETR
jgi:hypothetical protein